MGKIVSGSHKSLTVKYSPKFVTLLQTSHPPSSPINFIMPSFSTKENIPIGFTFPQ